MPVFETNIVGVLSLCAHKGQRNGTFGEVQLLEVTDDFSQLLELEDSGTLREQSEIHLAQHIAALIKKTRTVELLRDSFASQ